MNNILKGSLFFITGAAIASFITYKVVDKKYKKIADDEIASVREMYERKIKKASSKQKEEYDTHEIETVKETIVRQSIDNPYSSLVTDLGYSNNKEEDKEDMVEDSDIEVIPPEDFGEYGYKCESLTYYADKMLTFANDEIVTNVAKFIGSDALNTFGEYEDDSVFVRNHNMKTDFEILLDSRRYSDVVEKDD